MTNDKEVSTKTTAFIDSVPARLRKRYMATAYHEAGHAVTAHLLGRRLPRKVSIVPKDDSFGRAIQEAWPSWEHSDVKWTARTRDLFETEIITFMAGPAAETRFTGRANPRGARGDIDNVANLALRVGGDGKGASVYLKWPSLLAKRTVNVHWGAIERFAKKLLVAGELSGQALKDALGPDPP